MPQLHRQWIRVETDLVREWWVDGMSAAEIGKRIGKSRDYVSDRVKLAKLIPDLQRMFFEGKMNLTQAIALAGLAEQVQVEYFEENSDEDELYMDKADVLKMRPRKPEAASCGRFPQWSTWAWERITESTSRPDRANARFLS